MPLVLTANTNPGASQWVDASTISGGGARVIKGHLLPGVGGFNVDGPTFFDPNGDPIGLGFTGTLIGFTLGSAVDGILGLDLGDTGGGDEILATPFCAPLQLHTRCETTWVVTPKLGNVTDLLAGFVPNATGWGFVIDATLAVTFTYANGVFAPVVVATPTGITVTEDAVYEFKVLLDKTLPTPSLVATISRVITNTGALVRTELWAQTFTADLPADLTLLTLLPAPVFSPGFSVQGDSLSFYGLTYEFTSYF
jgi:hypothetical protein